MSLSLEVKKGAEIPDVFVPDEMQSLADLPCVPHVATVVCDKRAFKLKEIHCFLDITSVSGHVFHLIFCLI